MDGPFIPECRDRGWDSLSGSAIAPSEAQAVVVRLHERVRSVDGQHAGESAGVSYRLFLPDAHRSSHEHVHDCSPIADASTNRSRAAVVFEPRETAGRAACLLALVAVPALARAAAEPAPADAEWHKVAAAFASPPAEFRLIQYGTHDGAPLPAARMIEAGIGGVMLFMQSNGYLRSDDAWRNLETNIRAAREAGLQVWVGDDNGYPSGMAGGLVVEADPALESRALVALTQDGAGPGPARLDLPAWAEAFVSGRICPVVDGRPALDQGQPAAVHPDRIETEGLAGPWRLYGFARVINREGTQAATTASGFATSGRYPNLLDSAATEMFVALTHEQYTRRLGPLAGTIDAVYTNEPNLMTRWFLPGDRPGGVALVPWHEDLLPRFQAEHGSDLLPLLPALYGGDDAVSRLTRRHYYQTVGTVLAENFPRRIAAWGAGAGVRTAGHPLLEENMLHHVVGYGDFFRFVERSTFPPATCPCPTAAAPGIIWMPKFLSFDRSGPGTDHRRGAARSAHRAARPPARSGTGGRPPFRRHGGAERRESVHDVRALAAVRPGRLSRPQRLYRSAVGRPPRRSQRRNGGGVLSDRDVPGGVRAIGPALSRGRPGNACRSEPGDRTRSCGHSWLAASISTGCTATGSVRPAWKTAASSPPADATPRS